MEGEVKKNKNTGLYVIIGILCVMVLALGGYFVYKEYIEKDKDESFPTNDNINKDDTKTTTKMNFENIGTYHIKLNNKIVDVVVSGESTHREIKINNKKINIPLEYLDNLYVVSGEIIIITHDTGAFYENLYFYDKDINEINVDFKFEQNYNMKVSSITNIKDNKILVSCINELETIYLDGDTLCNAENIDNYKQQVSSAKYEIDYLGNNKFSKPKRLDSVEYISDICNK